MKIVWLTFRDELRMSQSVVGYNETVSALKEEIIAQQEYQDKLKTLDRSSYLVKGVPGNT